MSKYNFVITIKQPDYKTPNAISILMLLMSAAVFGYVCYNYWGVKPYQNLAIFYAVLLGGIVLWIAYCQFIVKKLNRVPYYRIALMVSAIGWFTEPVSNYWIAALYVAAALFERQVKFPQEIGVDEKGITFNSFPAKEYPWSEVENIILKDGIITVDYNNNNRFYQKEIESEVSVALEKEFNNYCRQQLLQKQNDAAAFTSNNAN